MLTAHRILELEQAGFELQDKLQVAQLERDRALQQLQTPGGQAPAAGVSSSDAPQLAAAAPAVPAHPGLLERPTEEQEVVQAELKRLSVALDNALATKAASEAALSAATQEAQQAAQALAQQVATLTSEVDALRTAAAAAEARSQQLEVSIDHAFFVPAEGWMPQSCLIFSLTRFY